MKKKCRLKMGPASVPAAGEAARFWNVASISEEEGEITLYGDVVNQQPVDWWTGEPEPGLYITPEGFMEDLESVKNKSRINVKLNSCGGDLYTGIAIHNALKALGGTVNVIVEGIAASAASVIMCAGDTVTVYPGSLIMIHGVSIHLWDSLNMQDMRRLMKGMDANERAMAEIYSAKTGIATDTLRSMMTKETWLTGAEALEKGFADVMEEGEGRLEMSISKDRKILYVNGILHDIEGFHNIPGGIPIRKSAKTAIKPKAYKKPGNQTAEGGKHHMTLEELKTQEPDLVSQIEQTARDGARAEAVAAERARIQAIDAIASGVSDPQMIHDAKYGEKPCTAQELSFRVMQACAASGQTFLASYVADGLAAGTAGVNASPNGGTPPTQAELDAADMQAVVDIYNQSRGGTR